MQTEGPLPSYQMWLITRRNGRETRQPSHAPLLEQLPHLSVYGGVPQEEVLGQAPEPERPANTQAAEEGRAWSEGCSTCAEKQILL